MNIFKRLFAVASAAAVLGLGTAAVAATYTPFGPQNDVAKSNVTGGGWTQVYSGLFNASVSYDTVFNNLSDWVMIASGTVGSSDFDLLASIRVEDFNAIATGRNVTELHNGAEWYRNSGSLGFAPAGATISQNSADVQEVRGPTADQRMSWHTQQGGYDSAPTQLLYGWRSGVNTGLNSSNGWERFVFTASDEDLGLTPVPLPASGLLLIAGFGGLAFMRKRKSA